MAFIRRRRGRDPDPFRDTTERELERPFEQLRWWPDNPHARHVIPVDIYEDGDDLVVRAAVPGIRLDDLHVEVRDNVLRIWGEGWDVTERREEHYRRREHRFGRFERSVPLPLPTEPEAARAEFGGGTLTLRLPRSTEMPGRKIEARRER